MYCSSRLGVKNQQLNLSIRVASVQNGSLTPIGNAILNTDSVFSGTAAVYGLPKAPSARVFNRTWGLKQYELSNHLGNVQVTISDKKLGVVGANQEDFVAYEPEVKSATDYYSYGMEMPGKGWNSLKYKYGAVNGQERINEITGAGKHYTAEYWEYSPQIGRRWNPDPIIKHHLSLFACFSNNPIWRIDPNGADDYFNSDGTFSHRTKSGSRIIVLNANKNEEISFSQFSASRNNKDIKASAKIVGHYRKRAGIPAHYTMGVSPNSIGSIAFSTETGIWISTSGGANNLMNNFYNMISTLKHEKFHVDNNDPKKLRQNTYTYTEHLKRYDDQMQDNATFEPTSNNFKKTIANNYARYLLGAFKDGEIYQMDELETKVNNFNQNYRKYGLKILLTPSSGGPSLDTVGLNDEGEVVQNSVIKADGPN